MVRSVGVADPDVAGELFKGVSSTSTAQVAAVYHADRITITDPTAGVSSPSNPFNVK